MFDTVGDNLKEVYESYCDLGSSISKILRKRQEKAVIPAVQIGYGIILAVAGVPIGMASLTGGFIFSVGAAIIPTFLPTGVPAKIVAKLYFRDPNKREIMQMETDIIEGQLPNAQENVSNLLKKLNKAGFKYSDINPFADDLPTVNHSERVDV